MNDDENNPFMGIYDDPAALDMNFSTFDSIDYLMGTTYTGRPVTNPPPQDNVPMLIESFINFPTDDKVIGEGNVLPIENPPHLNNPVQQHVKEEVVFDLEKSIQSFSNNGNLSVEIVESSRPRNKPYVMEDNILFIKPSKAVEIKVLNAQEGQIVKLSLRYKSKTHYRQPVLACSDHKEEDGQNPEATFYVYEKKNLVNYSLENRHHTALIPLTEEEGFCFYPIFRCWNFCGKKYGKDQKMILTVLDKMSNRVLHERSIDLRVCENVGRDLRQYRDERDGNPPRRTVAKRSRHQMEKEAQTSENLIEGPPSSRPRYFMVKMEDNSLVGTLESLAKVRGECVELDPAVHHPEKYFQ
ncbi:uncharacterized protein LOC123512532 isoform X2 [Portunus trituberculatus]|uniref:uncharacterized protein LOC123512532 isoform X2 n=1 Tax=Portunus trituberculatus TaxID=210409 RepID=UPI001E1CCBDE|nr:uncharacterized protein LOC123512532 isoform X2 [Portunus trituberculatus]